QALGEPPQLERARVLGALSAQLDREADPVLRQTLLVSLVSAGSTPEALAAIAERHADLAEDAGEWIAGLRSGATDLEQLYAFKRAREAQRLGPGRPATDGE